MPTIIDLTTLGSAGFAIHGADIFGTAGRSVASAGDVNGDGFDDLLIGAPASSYYAAYYGVRNYAYLVFGKAGGFADIDLASLTPAQGIVIRGALFGGLGYTVSSAGDVNADGYDDFLVSTPFEAGEDRTYVIFGKASGLADIDLAAFSAANGFVIQGDESDDVAGISVASAGDVNGDGYGDIIIGAALGDNGGTDAGEAYVIFGKASGFANIDLTSLAAGAGFIIQGDAAFDNAGVSVASAGDINGDGYDDIIVGAPNGDNGGTDAGEAYVIFGKASGFTNIDLTSLSPTAGFVIQGDASQDLAGRSVASAGDVNGDGYDDIIVGAMFGDNGGDNAGEAYVIFGKASGFANIDLSSLSATDGFVIQGDAADDLAGLSVASAGDVNGDGYDDIIVGAPYGDDGGNGAGEAYVIFGRAGGFANIDLANLAPADGFIIQGDSNFDNAGVSVASAGDVNGDGVDDIIVGASYGGSDTGAAYVIFGTAPAVPPVPGQTISGGAGDDTLQGTGGDDTLLGFGGNDILIGGAGNDIFYVEDAGDVVTEAASQGRDIVYASVGYALPTGSSIEVLSSVALGAITALNLTGNAFTQEIYGNAGANMLNGGGGADFLAGLGGDDIYFISSGLEILSEGAGQGRDIVYTGISYALNAGAQIEILSTSALGSTAAINLTGNAFAQLIYGNAGANTLNGGGGADYLAGLGGDDTYLISSGLEALSEGAGQGHDIVNTGISYALTSGAQIEVLSTNALGSTAINLTGNEFGQEIYGNAGANTLNGGGGADFLAGLGGDDIYLISSGAEILSEGAGQGRDIVYTGLTYALNAGAQIEILSTNALGSTAAINLTGNEFAQLIYGNAGANTLNGGGGADFLSGGGGADSFAFTAALGGGNVDLLGDFASGLDRILLDDAAFAGLALGALSAGAFRTGTSAQDADDRIIYNSATGSLSFDADGVGGAAAVQFASLQAGLSLSASDFTVI